MSSAHNFPPGTKLVNTWQRERRLEPHEIKAMDHTSQLQYFIEHGLPSDQQRQADLEREDENAEFDMSGEVRVNSRQWNEGPPGDW